MTPQSPAPWSAHSSHGGWIVRDFDGHDIVYIPQGHIAASAAYWMKFLTSKEARWIATNVAKLVGVSNEQSDAIDRPEGDARVFQKVPPPWNTYRGKSGSAYMVRAANGVCLAIIYYGGKQHLSETEAQKIAVEIARLPEHCRTAR